MVTTLHSDAAFVVCLKIEIKWFDSTNVVVYDHCVNVNNIFLRISELIFQILHHFNLNMSFQKHLLIAVTLIVGASCQVYTLYKYPKTIVSRQAVPQTAEEPPVIKVKPFYFHIDR